MLFLKNITRGRKIVQFGQNRVSVWVRKSMHMVIFRVFEKSGKTECPRKLCFVLISVKMCFVQSRYFS